MSGGRRVFVILTVILPAVSLLLFFINKHENDDELSGAAVIEKAQRLQIPFIVNEGQTEERVQFYANTFGGNVFITHGGEIIYSLQGKDEGRETRVGSPGSGVRKTGCVPQVIGNVIQSKFDILDLLLISCGGQISKIVSPDTDYVISQSKIRNRSTERSRRSPKSEMKGLALKEEIVGGKIDKIQGEGKTTTQVNYFGGNNPSKWKRNIPTYEVVNFGEVHEGIKLKLKAYGNNIEKLFFLKPYADPETIKIKLNGAHALRVNDAGQLEVETDLGTVRFTKPTAYQEIHGEKVEVAVEYRILNSEPRIQNVETTLLYPKSEVQNLHSETGNVYGFKVATYDKERELVIDPLLASTFLGGFESDYSNSIAIDSGKNIFVAGYTKSSNFPITTGAYDISYNYGDIFVSKLNGDLTQLLASTYLGGSSDDYVRSIAIDSSKNIYIAGQTSSSDFPTTADAYDTSKNGYSDAFVVRLSGDLTHLLASTFLGGASDDYVYSIAIDPSGIVLCVTGRTLSSDFPTTPGAYDTSYKNGDAFIAKLNLNLSRLLASTYLGGTGNDYGNSIAIDSQRNIYVCGDTCSSDFPTSDNAYDTSFNGGFGDVFVSKLNWDLTRVLASTFLGGVTDDFANTLAIDSHGNIYVSGQTESLDFPTTPAAYDTSFNNGDAFVSKLTGDLTRLLASTYLGGADDDFINSIAIGPDGNIYVGGYTGSSDFPTTRGAYDASKGVYFDAFVSKLSGDLTSLLASTFWGGDSMDFVRSIVIDPSGNIYVTGETQTSTFPTTPDAYDTSYNGNISMAFTYDAFVSKLDSNLSALLPANSKK